MVYNLQWVSSEKRRETCVTQFPVQGIRWGRQKDNICTRMGAAIFTNVHDILVLAVPKLIAFRNDRERWPKHEKNDPLVKFRIKISISIVK